MDGKGSRGAYAQVTAPIGDDPKVTIESGSKPQGVCSSCTRPKLIGAFIAAVVVVIIIIVVVVLTTKSSSESERLAQGTATASTVTKEMMSPTMSQSNMSNGVMMSPTMSQSSMSNGVMITTQPRPSPTFGPPVAGSFSGAFVMDRPYTLFFDDGRAALTTTFKANFTSAMNLVFNATAPFMYEQTYVDQLLQNGTNVQVAFTVSLNAINRGGRDHLIDTLGTFPSNAMQTYTVLYANVQAETKTLLDA